MYRGCHKAPTPRDKVVRGMTNVYCYLEHYPDDVEYWLDNRLNSASRAVTGLLMLKTHCGKSPSFELTGCPARTEYEES